MRREEILAWVGAILGFVGAVPTVLLFATEKEAIGTLVFSIVSIIVAGIFLVRWYLRLPQYSLLNYEKTLTFNDREGRSATQVSNIVLRANHPGHRDFRFKVLAADGPVKNFRINDRPPSVERDEGGGREVGIEFPNPLKRFEKKDLKLSFDWVDSYTEATESWTHTVAYDTKKLRLKVQFHPDRPYDTADASVRFGGVPYEPIEGFKRSDSRLELTCEVNKPKLGAQYNIAWTW